MPLTLKSRYGRESYIPNGRRDAAGFASKLGRSVSVQQASRPRILRTQARLEQKAQHLRQGANPRGH